MDQSKLTSQLPIVTSLQAGDRILVLSTSGGSNTTATIDISNFLGNVQVPINASALAINSPLGTPANSHSVVVQQGGLWFDSNYIYVAVANNVVKRVALNTF